MTMTYLDTHQTDKSASSDEPRVFKSTRKLSTDKKTPAVTKKSSVKKNSVGSEKKTVLKQTSSIDLSKPVQQRRKSSAGRKQSTEKQR